MVELDRMRCDRCGYEEVCDEHQIKTDWNERVPEGYVRRECFLPRGRFFETLSTLGATKPKPIAEALERLREAYDEPARAYHNALHIGSCLAMLDDPEVAALATHLAEVEAAIWFHDAVYDTHARDNEERSAALAEECLVAAGVARAVVERVTDHVLATRDHAARSADAALVVDVDLSILGADAATFEGFEQEIRREYAWVEPEAYAAGRTAVLRRFLERPAIYATALFRDRFEQRARVNLTSALERWRAGARTRA